MMLIYFLLLCLHNVVQCQIYHGYDLFPEKKWVSSDCTTSQNYLTLSSCIDSCTAVNWCKGGWYNTRWPRSCELCRDLTTSTPTVRAPSKMAFLREAEASLEEVILILTGMNDKLTKELEGLRNKLEKVESTLEEGESFLEELKNEDKCDRYIKQRKDLTCGDIDGTCIESGNACPVESPIGVGGPKCADTTKRCCYSRRCVLPEECCCETDYQKWNNTDPTNVEADCFYAYKDDQCYCIIASKPEITGLTWKDAQTQCANRGWLLPHPIDPVPLSEGIEAGCGDGCGPYWVNAKYDVTQNGGQMVWWNSMSYPGHKPVIKGTLVEFPGGPRPFKNGDCLKMGVVSSTKPYVLSENCEGQSGSPPTIKPVHHILCQKWY